MNIQELQDRIGDWAVSKGWSNRNAREGGDRSKDNPTDVERTLAGLAIKHMELSDTAEHVRKNGVSELEGFGDPMAMFGDPVASPEEYSINIIHVLSKLCLIHTEVTEAVEAAMAGKIHMFQHGQKPEGLDVELADVIIRCLQLADDLGLDVDGAVQAKLAYNDGRPWKHGKHA